MKAAEVEVSNEWKKAEGIPVLRLWDDPDVYPQTAVARMSHSEYLSFSKDRERFMEFVNKNKIFGKDVIFAGPWVSLSSDEFESHPSEWMVTMLHGKKSTIIVAALPQLEEEDHTSKWFSSCGHFLKAA